MTNFEKLTASLSQKIMDMLGIMQTAAEDGVTTFHAADVAHELLKRSRLQFSDAELDLFMSRVSSRLSNLYKHHKVRRTTTRSVRCISNPDFKLGYGYQLRAAGVSSVSDIDERRIQQVQRDAAAKVAAFNAELAIMLNKASVEELLTVQRRVTDLIEARIKGEAP